MDVILEERPGYFPPCHTQIPLSSCLNSIRISCRVSSIDTYTRSTVVLLSNCTGPWPVCLEQTPGLAVDVARRNTSFRVTRASVSDVLA